MFLLQPITQINITTVYIATIPLYIIYFRTCFYYNQQQCTVKITTVYITTTVQYILVHV